MLNAAPERVVQSSGEMNSASFGISQAHAAHIMGILRSTLYSRKALAVLREYGSNAWDEHRQSGQPDRPISVTLPTNMAPTLKIRDFGRGLSEHDVLYIYTQYGESTKRDTNDAAGMLGIGCKAGFCYADSFTVTSWHQGTKSVYIAVLDKSNKGEMRKVHEEPCGDETGIEIQVAIRPRDVDEFVREAHALFQYFNPQPKINIKLEPLPPGMARGFISDTRNYETTTSWLAIMGCIPYRLDLQQLKEKLTEIGLWETLRHLSGGIYLPIGSVEFSASREELQYTEITVNTLVEQIQALISEYVNDALSALNREGVPSWEKRLKAIFMHRTIKFPMPKGYRSWLDSQVPLYAPENKQPQTFILVDYSFHLTHMVSVGQKYQILLHNDPANMFEEAAPAKLKGGKKKADEEFKADEEVNVAPQEGNLSVKALSPAAALLSRLKKSWSFYSTNDVLAIPFPGCTLDEVRAEIEALCKEAILDGAPIGLLTKNASRRTHQTYNGYGTTRHKYPVNQKHKDRTFVLKSSWADSSPRSQYWEIAAPPTEEHVFVIISEFIPQGISLDALASDKQLFQRFGLPWPTLYGYKTLANKPVTTEDIENGTTYKVWRTKVLGALLTEGMQTNLSNLAWEELFDPYRIAYAQNNEKPREFSVQDLKAKLAHDLGEKHPVTRYFTHYLESGQALAKLPRDRREALPGLSNLTGFQIPKRHDPHEHLKQFCSTYPMLKVSVRDNDSNQFAKCFHNHYSTIVSYIRDIDAKNKGSDPTPEA